MSTPASRESDNIICPTHGTAGPVLAPTAHKVYMSGFSAARYTDLATCANAHVSPLAEGTPMVLINGLPAVRMGQKTLDGATLITGDPSVLIGGDTFSVPSFISIDGTVAFQAKVLRDLYLISSTPSGVKLLASLAASGHKVTICDAKTNRTKTNPQLHGVLGEENDPRANDRRGVDSRIEFNPDEADTKYASDVAWAHPPNIPPDSQLFHEMVHADDMGHGRLDDTKCMNVDRRSLNTTSKGELRAVGVGPYADESQYPYSENTYRRERGYERRTFY